MYLRLANHNKAIRPSGKEPHAVAPWSFTGSNLYTNPSCCSRHEQQGVTMQLICESYQEGSNLIPSQSDLKRHVRSEAAGRPQTSTRFSLAVVGSQIGPWRVSRLDGHLVVQFISVAS